MAYNLVTAGDLALMGADPTANDLAALLAATSGTGSLTSILGNELDALDAGGVMGLGNGYGYGVFGDNGGGISPQLQQAVLQQKLAASSLLTRTAAPTKAREYPLGFLSDAQIAAGAQVRVISRPQIVFRGERLIIPSDIAGQFSINDIIVGKTSQKVSTTPVPGRVFDERGVGVRMAMDTAQISQDIVLDVTNIGGAAATFRAAIIGAAVE